MNEWISVKDRLPKEEEEVLTFGSYGYVVGYYSSEVYDWQTTYGEVTHWMPLPDKPKEWSHGGPMDSSEGAIKAYNEIVSRISAIEKIAEMEIPFCDAYEVVCSMRAKAMYALNGVAE